MQCSSKLTTLACETNVGFLELIKCVYQLSMSLPGLRVCFQSYGLSNELDDINSEFDR